MTNILSASELLPALPLLHLVVHDMTPRLPRRNVGITEIESGCVGLTETLSFLMIRISLLKSSSSGNDLLSSNHS